MRILNVRLGLATNSSSSHSIIFLPKGTKAQSNAPDSGRQCYGWDYFQLTDKTSKTDYLAQSLFQQLKHDLGEDIAETVVRDWCGTSVDKEGYVDHQSTMTFPRNWEGKGINKEFIEDFKAFLMRDDIVIAGGNDNDENEPEATSAGGQTLRNLPKECYDSTWVARRDHNYWTLFNRDSGAKIRLTFDGNNFAEMPKRSSVPELIDIKITDYCPFECTYCYQDSTKEGKHADASWLSSLVYALKEAQVFEVAIGGGEPTLYPKFVELLQSFRYNGIVPNFTTKSLGWLKDKKQRPEILKAMGAFAYSCEKASDVEELEELCKKHDIIHDGYSRGSRTITIQHVMGVADEVEFRKILKACSDYRFPITLLGYKEVGRGPKFGKKNSAKWLDVLAEFCDSNYLRVGIDTALADRYWDQLKAKGVKEHCMTRVEGQFSCYIDAVAKTINTSSYNDKPGMQITDHPYSFNLGAAYRDLPHD